MNFIDLRGQSSRSKGSSKEITLLMKYIPNFDQTWHVAGNEKMNLIDFQW